MINHVTSSLASAEAFKSKLSPQAMNISSFTGEKIRYFLNNLGGRSDLHYLEVGVHKGGTFIAANFNNNMASSTAVDNWCEFPEGGESKKQFLDNVNSLLKPGSTQFLEMDCFDITKEHLPNPINLYLYDGGHSSWAQAQAITHFYPLLADEFILLVDDYAWDDVRNGTQAGIQKTGLKVLFEREMVQAGAPLVHNSNGWWNGFYVAVLKK